MTLLDEEYTQKPGAYFTTQQTGKWIKNIELLGILYGQGEVCIPTSGNVPIQKPPYFTNQ